MTHLVTESCIACKHTNCVDVCPVDCFHEGQFFLVINPHDCIDCGLCAAECPENAIKSDKDLISRDLIFVKLNQQFSLKWPSITRPKAPLPDASTMSGKKEKLEILFREIF